MGPIFVGCRNKQVKQHDLNNPSYIKQLHALLDQQEEAIKQKRLAACRQKAACLACSKQKHMQWAQKKYLEALRKYLQACQQAQTDQNRQDDKHADHATQASHTFSHTHARSQPTTPPNVSKHPCWHDYHTLGLQGGEEKQTIKKAYKKLALQYHPDKQSRQQVPNSEPFKAISQAYQNIMAYIEKQEAQNNAQQKAPSQDGATDDQTQEHAQHISRMIQAA